LWADFHRADEGANQSTNPGTQFHPNTSAKRDADYNTNCNTECNTNFDTY